MKRNENNINQPLVSDAGKTTILGTIYKKEIQTPLTVHLEFGIQQKPVWTQSFLTPGQYVVLKAPGFKDGFFALAGLPKKTTWEFLIKNSSPLSDYLINLPVWSQVEMTPAQGRGFDMEKTFGRHVYLLGVGSGIAPLRSALLWMLAQKENFLSIHLFYGAINPDEFSYASEFDSWARQGVKIQKIVYPENPAWRGKTGFVQTLLPKKLSDKKDVVLVCGMKEMVEGVKARCKESGLSESHILVNF